MDEANQDFIGAIRDANPAQFPDFDDVKRRLDEQAQTQVHHAWRQQGPELVCHSCPHQHSQWIGPKRLTGFSQNGEPITE